MCKNPDRKKLGGCRVSQEGYPTIPGTPQAEPSVGGCAEVVALCWQVITGLKQRIFRLEQQCKEKDNTIKYDLRAGGRCPVSVGAALGQQRRTSPSSTLSLLGFFSLLATSLLRPDTMRNLSSSFP